MKKKLKKKTATMQLQKCSFEYYIVDTQKNRKFGPFTKGQFLWECRTSGVGELPDWIKTKPRPHHAEVLPG